MKSLPTTLLLAGAALLAGGCAAPTSPVPSGPSSARYEESGYAWNDPFFYEPWYDSSAIVLPPPRPGAAVSGVRVAPAGSDSAGLKEVDYR